MNTKLFVFAAFVLSLAFTSCDSNDPLDPKSKSSSVPVIAESVIRKALHQVRSPITQLSFL